MSAHLLAISVYSVTIRKPLQSVVTTPSESRQYTGAPRGIAPSHPITSSGWMMKSRQTRPTAEVLQRNWPAVTSRINIHTLHSPLYKNSSVGTCYRKSASLPICSSRQLVPGTTCVFRAVRGDIARSIAARGGGVHCPLCRGPLKHFVTISSHLRGSRCTLARDRHTDRQTDR